MVSRENATTVETPSPSPAGQPQAAKTAGSPAAPGNAPLLAAGAQRILSLDQLRGYAIAGMIFVNWFGHYDSIHWSLQHQKTAFSYADTIAPLFIFVVGMGFRLSLLRRIAKEGVGDARWATFKRYCVLFLLGIAFYGPNIRIDWWDALVTIALGGLLSLPFIEKSTWVRVLTAFVYLGIYMVLFYFTGYGEWLLHRSMNGGPLGPFSWAFILLMGTIAYDLLMRDDQSTINLSLAWGIGLIVLSIATWYIMPKDVFGYAADHGQYWPFAKRWSVAPCMFLATGLSFLTFLCFYVLNDRYDIEVPTLSILGQNPLIIYLVQYTLLMLWGEVVIDSFTEGGENYELLTRHSGVIAATIGFALFYAFNYGVAWKLHKDKTIIKL